MSDKLFEDLVVLKVNKPMWLQLQERTRTQFEWNELESDEAPEFFGN